MPKSREEKKGWERLGKGEGEEVGGLGDRGGGQMWFRRKMLKKVDAVKMYSGWRSIQACIRD